MLIRSQDKRSIVNLDNIDTLYINHQTNIINSFNGSIESSTQLGVYSTEEKAIKVLDMIQGVYLDTTKIVLNDSLAAKCFPRATIFQMPQDSEV